jgi:hypothetical protein
MSAELVQRSIVRSASKEEGTVSKVTLWRFDASNVGIEEQQNTYCPKLQYILRLSIFSSHLFVADKHERHLAGKCVQFKNILNHCQQIFLYKSSTMQNVNENPSICRRNVTWGQTVRLKERNVVDNGRFQKVCCRRKK